MTRMELAGEVESVMEDLFKDKEVGSLVSWVKGKTRIKCIFNLGSYASFTAKISKLSELHVLLGTPNFVIEVHKKKWSQLNEQKRKILILHELLHLQEKIVENKPTEIVLIKHDIEDFDYIIQKYGLHWIKEK